MNQEKFIEGMALLKEAFPARSMNPKIYFVALKDLSDEDFERAVLSVVQDHKELYPDSNLVAIIREYAEGKLDDHAILAWDTALKTAGKYDYYFTVSFEDKIINGVILAMGSWEKFSSMLISEQPFFRKEFLAIYEAYARSGRVCPEKLSGNFERINMASEKVILIEADYLKKNLKRIGQDKVVTSEIDEEMNK